MLCPTILHAPMLILHLCISAECRNVQFHVLHKREQSLDAVELKKKTIGRTVIQATEENHFSSPSSRMVSYHFTTIEMVSVSILCIL